MMKKTFLAALLATAVTIGSAQAAVTPRDGGADARVKHVIYHEQDVTVIKGHYGYSTVIEFSNSEAVKTISMGDSVAWQVTPANTNLLFIKPLEQNANTNMTVVTTKRIYSFDLSADDRSRAKTSDLTYRLRFIYPDEEAAALARIGEGPMAGAKLVSGSTSPADWNFDYKYSGHSQLRPTHTFDDGKFTYFKFVKIERTPAIFVVDNDGNESLVNYHKEGDYIVVERLGRRFTLRDGDYATCIFNEAFPVVNYVEAPLAPAPVTHVAPVAVKEIDQAELAEKTAPKPKTASRGGSFWEFFSASTPSKPNRKRSPVIR